MLTLGFNLSTFALFVLPKFAINCEGGVEARRGRRLNFAQIGR
jgi:hypothetical protein